MQLRLSCERKKRIFLIQRSAKEKLDWRNETNKIGKGSRNPRIRFLYFQLLVSLTRPEIISSFFIAGFSFINPFTLIVRNQCNQVPRSWFIGKGNSFQISNPLRFLSKCTFHFHSVDHVRVRQKRGVCKFSRKSNCFILFFQTIFLSRKNRF